ncbi:MAG: phosphatidate cytidylyltransferase [Gammaproteobacteria bacterium]|nr:phosphatidate cytidylyltransferase [Gammaproteobacteria bacterium]
MLRLLTAMLLAPIAIALTVLLPNVWFALLVGVFFLMGLREWHQLSGCSCRVGIVGALLLISLMLIVYLMPKGLYAVSAFGAAYWLFQIFSLITNPTLVRKSDTSFVCHSTLVLLSAWAALVLLHQYTAHGPIMTIGFMAAIWAADSVAYFSGKAFGKNKLAPKISPGKTIEGVVGGAIGAVIFAIGFCWFSTFISYQMGIVWSVLILIAALVSVVGDLYESRLKRSAGTKDSGSLLPGHGGVLDRIDGLLAAAPVFVTFFLR